MLAKLASIIAHCTVSFHNQYLNTSFIQSSSNPSNRSDLNIFVTFEVFSMKNNFFYQNLKLSIDIRNEVKVTFDFVETCNGLMLNIDNYTPELFSLTMTVTKEGKKTFTLKCIFKVIFVDQKVHVPKCKHSSTKMQIFVFQNQEVIKLAKNEIMANVDELFIFGAL